jgi:hypothetical protein
MIGGGAPVGVPAPTTALVVTYNDYEFHDLSSLLPSYVANPAQSSSILAITYAGDSWILGGYADGRGILLFCTNSTTTDVSYLVKDSMSTVNWVGAGVEKLGAHHFQRRRFAAADTEIIRLGSLRNLLEDAKDCKRQLC